MDDFSRSLMALSARFGRAVASGLRLDRRWKLLSSDAGPQMMRPRSESHRVRPIVLRSDDGARLSGWLMTPRWPEAKGAILYFGNGSEEALWLARDAQAMFPEMTILAMHYRPLVDKDEQAHVQHMVADGEMLFDWLAESHQHLSSFPIVVMGRSFGAGIAVKVAASRTAAALTLLTPCDVTTAANAGRFRLLRRREKRGDEPAFLLKQLAPVLILRAQKDEIVPATRTDAFVARLPALTQDMVIAGSDHYDLPYRRDAQDAISAFLRSYVIKPVPLPHSAKPILEDGAGLESMALAT